MYLIIVRHFIQFLQILKNLSAWDNKGARLQISGGGERTVCCVSQGLVNYCPWAKFNVFNTAHGLILFLHEIFKLKQTTGCKLSGRQSNWEVNNDRMWPLRKLYIWIYIGIYFIHLNTWQHCHIFRCIKYMWKNIYVRLHTIFNSFLNLIKLIR